MGDKTGQSDMFWSHSLLIYKKWVGPDWFAISKWVGYCNLSRLKVDWRIDRL